MSDVNKNEDKTVLINEMPTDKLVEALRKASKEEDEYIRKYKEEQTTKLVKLIQNAKKHRDALQKAKAQLKSMKPSDENYEDFKNQIEELQRVSNGAEKERDSFMKALRESNQQNIINQAKEADATSRMKAAMEKSKESLDKANEDLARAEYEQFWQEALDDRDGSTAQQKEHLERSRQKTEKARQEKNKAEESYIRTSNPSNYEDEDLEKKIAKAMGSMPTLLQNIAEGLFSKEHTSESGKIAATLSEKLSDSSPLGKIGSASLKVLGKILDVAMAARKTLDGYVDDAANVLALNVGKINAALEGTGKTYKSALSEAVEGLGINRFVRQTDYLAQIANLTTQGVTFNVEQRALLETIKDKTINSFSSLDANILRLVRLTEADVTANQFGLEVALRNTLNKVFKDSTYLQGIYDSISSAITDAVMISGRSDITQYSSVAQTWMGAMYESGIDSSTVNKFANAINYLGSGNVQGLSSDADMQRLILLSMDTIGMDYADILQQGLSASDITKLMAAMVDYLSQIAKSTKNNNVLQSSYTQLFGMSMADLQGFQNLQSKMNALQYVTNASSLKVVEQELARYQSDERVMINEQIANVFDNAKFIFGSDIAEDASQYIAWKTTNLILDITSAVLSNPSLSTGAIGKAFSKGVGAIGVGAEIALFLQTLHPFLETMKGLPAAFKSGENGILQSYITGPATMGGTSASSGAAVTTSSNTIKTTNASALASIRGDTYNTEIKKFKDVDWYHPEEEKNETLEEIKKITSTIVESKEAKKALATYLVGMTDDTLRSFASIFADENAMQDTFQGKNKTLQANLFNFADDKTSNSSKKTTKTTANKSKTSSNTVSGNIKTT